MMQVPPPPMGPPPSAHTYMIPPPIESLLCSSAAPLSLPYWLQPPGCRSTVTKSQNRIYQPAKLSSPAKSQGSTRQLRPVIKTGFNIATGGGGGSLSSGSGPDSGSDSEVSSQPRNSPPSAPKKVVTFNYLTQVQLVDI
ncbi:uncharacterized protein LOC100898744 [Galendromus occidentalis]|uniref:Uncharacterized protein LOC100898744 n=1 Tax=Galendromus occidentalis TaxID=34638 RepID=A0AAJ6QS69_9ACAR|nr:uncharacterized protein LOC100898744 [Galendromus occidentalis]